MTQLTEPIPRTERVFSGLAVDELRWHTPAPLYCHTQETTYSVPRFNRQQTAHCQANMRPAAPSISRLTLLCRRTVERGLDADETLARANRNSWLPHPGKPWRHKNNDKRGSGFEEPHHYASAVGKKERRRDNAKATCVLVLSAVAEWDKRGRGRRRRQPTPPLAPVEARERSPQPAREL